MTIEEALLYLTENDLWSDIDKSFGDKVSRSIRSNRDLPNKTRQTVYRKLNKYKHLISDWRTFRKNLSVWKQVKVNKGHRKLPRLDFNGKDFLLYVGINQVDLGRKMSRGKRKSNQLLWKFTSGTEMVQELMAIKKLIKYITPNAMAHINDKLEKVMEKERLIDLVQEIKDTDNVDYSLTLKTPPYEHQKKAMKIGTTLDRVALLMEQGTGKTLSAIGIATQRYLQGQVKRILIVAPKSVLPEWAMQFKEHTDLPYQAEALDMKSKGKLKIIDGWKDIDNGVNVLTINYESLPAFESNLIAWNPDMIILDESQKVKSPTTKQSLASYNIADKANVQYRLILTGTPVSESPLDFFGQYRFLDPTIFGYSYTTFRNRYAEYDYRGFKIKYFKNQEELASKAHSIAYRVTKKEAKLGLPKETYKISSLPMVESERLLYNNMVDHSILEVTEETTISAPLLITQLLRLQQMTGGFIKDEEGNVHQVGTTKLDHIKKVIRKRVKLREKTVIFCRFTSEIQAIQEYLEKIKVGHEVLTGSTKDRSSILTSFKEDPDSLFFLAQIKAGGVGITLTSANMAIFYSTGYSLIDYEQAKARIHRIGQKEPVTYLHLIAKDSIDEVIYNALRSKKDIADLFVDQMKYINSKNLRGGEDELSKLDKKLNKLRKEMKKTKTNEEELEMKKLNEELDAATGTEEVVTKKKKKKAKVESTETPVKAAKADKGEVVTIAQIAEEIGESPSVLRRQLRNSDLEKVEGRWEWPVGHPDIEKVKSLKADIEAENEAKAARKAEKEAAKKAKAEAVEEDEAPVAKKSKKKKKKAPVVEVEEDEDDEDEDEE